MDSTISIEYWVKVNKRVKQEKYLENKTLTI